MGRVRPARRWRVRGGKSDGPVGGQPHQPAAPPGAPRPAGQPTTGRAKLARSEHFEQISPEVGQLDRDAFERALGADADAVLALLAEMTAATDPALRALARQLAAELFVELPRRGPHPERGYRRLRRVRFDHGDGDIDLDAGLEYAALATALGDTSQLYRRAWSSAALAVCLVVDRSGSMGGAPLASAALAAAATAWRCAPTYAVVAFARDAQLIHPFGGAARVSDVVAALLAARGAGTTNLDAALRLAADQLATATAARRVTVLFSDCRATAGARPGDAARGLDELVVVAPVDDSDEAVVWAGEVGARLVTVAGPSDVPRAMTAALAPS